MGRFWWLLSCCWLCSSCSTPRTAPTGEAAPEWTKGLILVEPSESVPTAPQQTTVTFDIQWIRDWDSPYYITGSDVRVLTIKDCPRYGISDEFFLWCLIHVPEGSKITVQIPKPIRL